MAEKKVGKNLNFQLTNKDKKILELLQVNARETTVELARKLGVSRSTVQERISKLEKANVIEGYSVRINRGVALHAVRALVLMRGDNKLYRETLKVFQATPAVQSVDCLSGEWDWALNIACDTLEDFNSVLLDMNNIPGVTSTISHLILENQMDRRFIF